MSAILDYFSRTPMIRAPHVGKRYFRTTQNVTSGCRYFHNLIAMLPLISILQFARAPLKICDEFSLIKYPKNTRLHFKSPRRFRFTVSCFYLFYFYFYLLFSILASVQLAPCKLSSELCRKLMLRLEARNKKGGEFSNF